MIAVVGGGAMGSLLAGLLADAGESVVLVDHSPEHVRAVRSGLTIQTGDGSVSVPVPATTDPGDVSATVDPGAVPVDVLLVCVKSYDTASAMAAARPLYDESTTVCTLQNGLGNAETVASFVPAENVLAGTTAHGATLEVPGRVVHAGKGPTRIGRWGGENDERVHDVAATLSGAGVETAVVADVERAIWEKVAVNAGINAATALAGVENGALADAESGDRLLAAATREAVAVARAAGHDLDRDVVERAREVVHSTAGNVSSMRADLEAGSRTEVEAINGAVAARGEATGVDVPVNRTLADLVRLAESHGG